MARTTRRERTLAAAALGLLAGCGSKEGVILSSHGADAGRSAEADDSGSASELGDDSGVLFHDDDGSTPSSCTSCSSDLHQLLDCQGNVVKTCAAGTGCSPTGSCVAPCDAAKANRTAVGCEYYALDPDGYSSSADAPHSYGSFAGSCYAMFVANTWSSPVTVNVDYSGQSIDVSSRVYTAQGGGVFGPTYTALSGGQIPTDQVGILFLAQGANAACACPPGVNVIYTNDAAIHGTGRGHAFHVTTSAPVVAFDIWPFGGGSVAKIAGGTLLLPTSVWDTNYVAVTAFEPQTNLTDLPGGGIADSNISFVASQDNTNITIKPVADIAGAAGVDKATKGIAKTYTLDRGESMQFSQATDLSGSAVLADKPIGTWGGHWGMEIPANMNAEDANHQQIPPVSALGREYVAVRYRSRTGADESVPWRLMGVVDGTQLSYAPSAPTNAPKTVDLGQVVEFDSPGPFVVSSQDAAHPFYFAGHMTDNALAASEGDPETVNVVPPSQFLSHYVFFTDPTYSDTNLVVVRPKGGPDVTLDCASGALGGWMAVGTRYEYTRADVQKGGAMVGNCDNGRHEMTSKGPFGLTVWGWNLGVSYAYPGGAGVRPINKVVVSPGIPR